MPEPTQPDQTTEAQRVAALQAQAARDYAAAQNNQAAARNQLAEARTHGNEAAGA